MGVLINLHPLARPRPNFRQELSVDCLPTVLSDESILANAASGSPESVAACVERFAPMVYAMAKQGLGGSGGSSAAIEDAAQDVFIELWKHAGRFDGKIASARAFVGAIAKRRIIDRYRAERAGIKARSLDALAESAPGVVPAGQTIEGSEVVRLAREDDASFRDVRSALESLPFEQRSAIRMSVVEGLAHQDIADRLSLPLGTVKSHLRRGLHKLRDLLETTASGSTSGAGA